MRNAFLLSIGLLLFLSCQQPQPPKLILKECTYQTSNPTLQLYNDVLIELVENNFHGYLGRGFADSAWALHNPNELTDTAEIYEEINKVYKLYSQRQRDIFNNPEKWCILYLDTAWRGDLHFEEITKHLPKDRADYLMAKRFGVETQDRKAGFIDNLQIPQSEFTAEDFQACTFSVANIAEPKADTGNCEVGRVQLSQVVFNKTQDKAWLYVEYYCNASGNCGWGQVLSVQKADPKWVIKKTDVQWMF